MLSNPPTPFGFVSTFGNHPGAGAALTSVNLIAINDAYLTLIRPDRSIVAAFARWTVGGTASGNYDIGIYTLGGTRLWSKGSTAWPTASSAVADAVSSVPLSAGVPYWVAIAGDNTSGQYRGATLLSASQATMLDGSNWCLRVTTSFPLPASITPGSTLGSRVPMVALTES